MAARRTPPPQKASFQPSSENVVYRDLLLFEERLKTNAALLKRRKSRYQLFVAQLLAVLVFLVLEVFLQTQFLTMPWNFALQKAFPEDFADGRTMQLHPYIAKGMLLVDVTTLVLFFASGVYEEKIGYANRYVPHANRALRSFNMYLNVRHRPLRSRLFVNPLSFFFHRDNIEDTSSFSRSASPDRRRKRGTSVPIPPIPPTNNPRGELIFSSRVERNFRESYERYRAAFERKREAREQYATAQTWWGWRVWPWNWMQRSVPRPASYIREHSPMRSIASTPRGRGSETESASSASSTPSSSRRSSPVPGSLGRPGGGAGKNRSVTLPGGIPRRLTPDRKDRTRKESFSFLLSGDQSFG
ncbi:Spo7-like protein-domain-containing protein [Phellopilus nigrolimitatus]|nr:Spo7-like protein-domain-containing protein [Phellopilus nigrolimitatus]